jgi:O-methyltransferase
VLLPLAFLDKLRYARNIGIRFTALRVVAAVLCPEYRMRYNMLDWMSDDAFNKYLQLIGEYTPLKSINAGRRWMIYQLIRLTEKVPGDTAECGVFRGGGSYLIASFLVRSRLSKAHHLFDSFEGLSGPESEDGTHWRKHNLAVGLAATEKLMSRFPNIHIYKGWIPNRFQEIANRQFSFVHIDVDLYQPTRDSIEFFYPRLTPGGIIICDDYGSSACPGATKAMNEFLQDKSEKMVALSDGGGFLIKGISTSGDFFLR